ncbi:MAG: hypothetical protein KA778_03275 [Burkholderiaceae bacterium]|nr:hypothetical protein [Burkholderiaceae bacterium]
MRLVERGRRLHPTRDAAPILAYAERALHDASRTLAEVGTIRTGGSGRVRVGIMLVALPLTLAHDTGDVGLVWREPSPNPTLQTVLDAFVQAKGSARGKGSVDRAIPYA